MLVYNYETQDGVLYHHGIKGMKWGVRRYKNLDGSLTARGQKRYSDKSPYEVRTADGVLFSFFIIVHVFLELFLLVFTS